MVTESLGEPFHCSMCWALYSERNDGGQDNYCQACSVDIGDGETLNLERAAICAGCCQCGAEVPDFGGLEESWQ